MKSYCTQLYVCIYTVAPEHRDRRQHPDGAPGKLTLDGGEQAVFCKHAADKVRRQDRERGIAEIPSMLAASGANTGNSHSFGRM